jgi:DNA-binding transcriptional MerR regulator
MHVYTAADIKQIYKLTQKQIDDLDKSSVIKPSIRPAQGKGSQRLYSFEDLLFALSSNYLMLTGL